MAIGLFTGRSASTESVMPAYATVQRLLKTFEFKFGSTSCQVLTGCNLGTDEGQNYFKTNNLIERCKGFTEEATRITMSLIEQKLGSPDATVS